MSHHYYLCPPITSCLYFRPQFMVVLYCVFVFVVCSCLATLVIPWIPSVLYFFWTLFASFSEFTVLHLINLNKGLQFWSDIKCTGSHKIVIYTFKFVTSGSLFLPKEFSETLICQIMLCRNMKKVKEPLNLFLEALAHNLCNTFEKVRVMKWTSRWHTLLRELFGVLRC